VLKPFSWIKQPAPPSPTTGDPAPGAAKSPPPRWAAGLVAVVLVLAAVLAGTGTPIGVVLEVLAGAGYIGTEIVRRLNGA
jgi:hypothetical protein